MRIAQSCPLTTTSDWRGDKGETRATATKKREKKECDKKKKRVEEQHVRAAGDELTREVAADEPESARDHHAAAVVEPAVLGCAHGCFDSGRTEPATGWRSSTPGACWRRTTSCSHSFITSTPVQNTRLKLKNCERPCVRW